MSETRSILALLQHADSFFPSGAASFSWGLETLRAEGRLRGEEDVRAFVAGQLRHRWATADRPALVAAHRAKGNLADVESVDRMLEALTLPREMREGSRRVGGSLLRAHRALETPGAAAYGDMVRGGAAHGHGAAVQGFLWQAVGIDEEDAARASAHGLVVGLLGAALRMGMLGHTSCQRILSDMREVIIESLAAPAPAIEQCRAYCPEAEIAIMRHETGDARLFAN